MVRTSSPSFAEYACRLRPQVDAALESCCQLGEGCPATLQEAIRYVLLAPGKRLRPMLVLLAAEACGGDIEAAMPAACAVEMVHAYSLVHDDLPPMDDDDLRRGRPTCHKAFGEALAILTGDALLSMAFAQLSQAMTPPTVAAACCAALAEATGPCQLVGGQADDLAAADRQRQAVASITDLERIHHRKTGAMIRVSLRLGGLAALANAESLDALDQYGHRLGLAFQITDDLLDVCGDEATAGKRLGKDSRRGKVTFPSLLGVKASMAHAQRLITEACAALGPLGPPAEGLETLARYVLERNR